MRTALCPSPCLRVQGRPRGSRHTSSPLPPSLFRPSSLEGGCVGHYCVIHSLSPPPHPPPPSVAKCICAIGRARSGGGRAVGRVKWTSGYGRGDGERIWIGSRGNPLRIWLFNIKIRRSAHLIPSLKSLSVRFPPLRRPLCVRRPVPPMSHHHHPPPLDATIFSCHRRQIASSSILQRQQPSPSSVSSSSFVRVLLALIAPLLFCLLMSAVVPSIYCQEVPEFMLSRKDIVDKNVEPSETVLSSNDFANIPEKEVDLRRLGIRVELDPTMGNKVEGDIVEWSPAKGATTTTTNAGRTAAMPKRNKGGGGGSKPDGTDNKPAGGTVLFDENGLARNALRQPYRRWPRNEIPYAVSSQYGSYSRSVIAKAISDYNSKTCVRFVPRDARKHTDYVWIHPDDGCYSLVGRTGGRQPLSLDSGCIQVGTVVHELMHAVGYDRDSYIQILWPNVLRGADDQFEKYSYNTIDQLGEPYDYGSIMHYGPYAFSSNGKRTIVPRRAGANRMGQRVSFSETDLRKINKLYQCEQRQTNPNNRGNVNGRNWGQQQQQIDDDDDADDEASSSSAAAPAGDDQCEDKNWRCLFWSMPMLQYCARSESMRADICPLSCGTCTPPPASKKAPAATRTSSADEDDDDQTATGTLIDAGGVPDGRRQKPAAASNNSDENADECVDKSPMCRHINREALCVGLLGRLFCHKRCARC